MRKQSVEQYRRQRLQQFADKKHEGNKASLGRALGYRDGAFVGQMLRGERPITEKTIDQIHALPGGRGWFSESNVAIANIGGVRIPLISHVQAGVWTEVVDNFQPGDADDWLITDLEVSPATFALQIKGDSMLPEFKPGDLNTTPPVTRFGGFFHAWARHRVCTERTPTYYVAFAIDKTSSVRYSTSTDQPIARRCSEQRNHQARPAGQVPCSPTGGRGCIDAARPIRRMGCRNGSSHEAAVRPGGLAAGGR